MDDQRFPDLRAFIERLRRDDDLVVVEAEVDAELEIAEIHRRVIAAGGPALLFTKVRNADFPVVTNLFGTARRSELAFGRRPQRLIRRLVELVEELMPPSPAKLWGARDVLGPLLKIGTRRRRSGPVTDKLTSDVRLDRLPVLKCWSADGGPFITLPLVHTRHPETGGANLGIYRLQVHDARSTGMHWQIGKGGGFHYARAEALGRPLDVTVLLGGPPALTLAAIAPLPENVPELMLASLIAGQRLPPTRIRKYTPEKYVRNNCHNQAFTRRARLRRAAHYLRTPTTRKKASRSTPNSNTEHPNSLPPPPTPATLLPEILTPTPLLQQPTPGSPPKTHPPPT